MIFVTTWSLFSYSVTYACVQIIIMPSKPIHMRKIATRVYLKPVTLYSYRGALRMKLIQILHTQ